MSDLNTKYRPTALNEVLGHHDVVASIRNLVAAKDKPQQFLFSGGSGIGKTTLARILATELGCEIENYDGGLNRTTDDVESLLNMVRHRPLGGHRKAIIFDECHALSKKAWDSLLMSIEEPPEHLVWIFSTTEPEKLPQAIITRCHEFKLKGVSFADIQKLLEWIAAEEGYSISPAIIEHCAIAAEGSVRQAVVNLSKARECQSIAEAKAIIVATEVDVHGKDLAMAIWKKEAPNTIFAVLKKVLDNPEAEKARQTIMNYTSGICLNAKTQDERVRALEIMGAFENPYTPATQRAELIRDVGGCVYGNIQEDF